MEINFKHPEERSKPTELEIATGCTAQKLALLLSQDNIQCKKKPKQLPTNKTSFLSLAFSKRLKNSNILTGTLQKFPDIPSTQC